MKRPISTRDIVLGKPLPHDIVEPDGLLLLRKGHIVNSESQIHNLLARGLFVHDESAEPVGSKDRVSGAHSNATPIEIITDSYQKLERTFDRLLDQKTLADRIPAIARNIMEACKRDTDAALGAAVLLVLGQSKRYVIRHPIFAAIICNIISAAHHLSEEQTQSVLCAALTMNVAMIKLQEQLYHQTAPLTPEQRARVQTHPQQSYDMLVAAGVTDEIWLHAVLEHHENLDGEGYPRRLKEEEISTGGQLLLFADHYCAKVSSRGYRAAVLPNIALRDIFLNSKYLARAHMASAYIKLLSIYPPGTFVQLRNGEIAIVTKRGKNVNCPIVQSVIGSSGTPLVSPILRDTNAEVFAIAQPVKPANIRVIPGPLWGYAG